MSEKKIPFIWTILGTFVLWGFLGTVAYICGTLARAALVG